MIRFGSVCSGIGAPEVAWHPMGWRSMFAAEIEKFPSAVLAHRFPDVPNLGDLTKIDGASWRDRIDVLVGGTPCQAFSVAGLRRSLEDARGNLTLSFVALPQAMTRHGRCETCGSHAVMRAPLKAWHWLERAAEPEPQQASRPTLAFSRVRA